MRVELPGRVCHLLPCLRLRGQVLAEVIRNLECDCPLLLLGVVMAALVHADSVSQGRHVILRLVVEAQVGQALELLV